MRKRDVLASLAICGLASIDAGGSHAQTVCGTDRWESLREYNRSLTRLIQGHVANAQGGLFHGEAAVLELAINRDGEVASSKLVKPSRLEAFNRILLSAAPKGAKFPPTPCSGTRVLHLRIPIQVR
ncbi:energy transducer TonB family protein [Methylobacterium sp. ID0610]|uniref:energy transducer TonB family protein n=1 Tax=Methylobacterium carpenticola TaxID=3344827 RepID=UPI003689CDC5